MFNGWRVLIVEDEYLQAEDLRRQLQRVGVVVLGPEPTIGRALSRLMCEPRIDAAILDINVGGLPVFPVADALIARQVPCLFATGYQEEAVESRYPGKRAEIVLAGKTCLAHRHQLPPRDTLVCDEVAPAMRDADCSQRCCVVELCDKSPC